MSINTHKIFSFSSITDNNRQYINIYRGMCIVGALLYPLFYFIYNNSSSPYPSAEFIPFMMAGVCVFFLVGTYYSEYLKTHIQDAAQILFYAFTLHALYNLHQSSFEIAYLIGFIVMITIFSVAINEKSHLNYYSILSFVAFAVINFGSNRFNDAILYQSNIGTIFLIFHIVLANKIELIENLHTKAELMYSLFCKSPDAIIFIDLKKNEIINCNDKSLELFEYENKHTFCSRSLESFFETSDSLMQWTEILKSINTKNYYNREEKLISHSGRSFWADVALTEFKIKDERYIVARIQDIHAAKEAETAVAHSEEKFRDLIESSKDLICIHDVNGKILTANPAFNTMLGYPTEHIIGSNLMDYMFEEYRPAYFKYIDELIDKGTNEGIMKAKDVHGKIKLLEFRNTIKKDENGNILVRGMAVDVTEKIQLQQQLIKREERFRLISENSCDLICQHKLNGDYDYISLSVSRLLGYDTSEMYDTNPMQYIHEEDKKLYKLLSPFYTEQIDMEPSSVEYRMIHKNGNVVWVNTIFKPVLNEKGEVFNYQSASRDISERKKAEALQERKDQLFKALTEASKELLSNPKFDVAILYAFKILGETLGVDRVYCFENSIDNKGIIYFNHRFEWDKESNSFLNDRPRLQHLPYETTLPRWYETFKKGGVVKGMAQDFPEPEKTLLDIQGSVSILMVPIIINNVMWGFIGFDYSKQKHVWSAIEEAILKTAAAGITGTISRMINEKEILSAKDEAESASKVKETFLANVSHEVRTPMNGIIGLTNLLQKSELDDTQKKYINAIKQSGEFLLAIINDLLDFSKIVAGHMEFENIPFDVNSLIFNINQTYGARAIEKGIQLKIEVDEMIPRQIKGDPVRLNQILVNLLGNSIKFTEQGYVGLNIKLINRIENRIRLGFTISDTGIGIPEEKQDSIFESFKQVGAETSRKYGGTGLGLSIVKKLLEAQNSTIILESKLGQGSKFMFDLEFEIASSEILAAEQGNDYISLSGVRILLAEDNVVNQLLSNDLISGWGAHLDMVENGELAVDKIKKEKYDLILMDVQMPVLGGLEATEIIRNYIDNQELKNIPIIAMTADAIKQNIQKCFDAGMTDHITKPFNALALNHLIWKHVSDQKKKSIKNNSEVITLKQEINTVEKQKEGFQYISLKTLHDFSRGKNDFVIKMLKLLLEQTPPAVDGIELGINNQDWAEVRALAHKMKPNINLVGNQELDRMILKIEKDSDAKVNLESMPDLFASFKKLYDCAIKELEEALQQYMSNT